METMQSSPRRWQDLPPAQRSAVSIIGMIQVALFLAAQIDMIFRPADQVRGKKLYWRLAAFINFFGPLAYFIFGIRRSSGDSLAAEEVDTLDLAA